MSVTRKIDLKRLFLSLLVVAILSTSWSYVKPNAALATSSTVTIPNFDIPAVTDVQKASEKPNIIVIGTGGTLAGKANNGDPTSFQSYAAGTYLIADLVAQLPNKEKIADVSTYQFGNKGSGGYSIQELYDLSLAVEQSLEQYDGAVVTTGTDTMEEIAYFLDLTIQSEKPVVVTGSMRPWDVIGTDAPANLYQAIKTAASNKTKWYGTVIMLNDTIQAAREVTKGNTHRTDTFDTAMFGALGYVDDSAVRMYRLNGRASKAGTAQWKTPFNLKTIAKADLPSVGILYNYQAAGAGALNGLVEEGVQGIVTAGTGAGGISSALSSARSKAIKDKNIIFVSTSRTGSGSVYSSGNGIISGDNLDPQHARIMLILTLAFTDDFNQMKTWFATVGTQEISISVANDEVTPEPTPTPTPTPIVNKITVDGKVNDWSDVESIATSSNNMKSVKVTNDETNLYILLEGSKLGGKDQIYFNSDNDSKTGYLTSKWSSSGVDYLLEDGRLYSYNGDGKSWLFALSENLITSKTYFTSAKIIEIAIPLHLLNLNISDKIYFGIMLDDKNAQKLPTSGEMISYTLQ